MVLVLYRTVPYVGSATAVASHAAKDSYSSVVYSTVAQNDVLYGAVELTPDRTGPLTSPWLVCVAAALSGVECWRALAIAQRL